MHNNKIIVDLNKVQYASFGWRNQHGQWSSTKRLHSALGRDYNPDEPAFNAVSGLPAEMMEERAKRLKLKDIWTPEVKLQLQANHRLVYTGEKAQSIWREWNRRQFKKKGK